jgi:NAD-dependent deacetylase
MSSSDPTTLEALADSVARADGVMILTGAGISTPSGIPDFRSPGTGLWEGVDPMAVAHVDVLRDQPELFWRFYSERFTTLSQVRPNRAHEVVVELERRGIVTAVVTQNVDRLHTAAGSEDVIELHGSITTSTCLACGAGYGLEEVRRRAAEADDGIPECDCSTMLRPGVVLFGEMLPQEAMRSAAQAAAASDLVICIGSSLEVHPAAGLPQITLSGGGELAIITQGPTPLDGMAQYRLAGDVVAELEALLSALDGS